MNREEAKALLPVIQAFAEGKDIECRARQPQDTFGPWIINRSPVWSDGWEHRIKPEKQERWLNIYLDNEYTSYDTKEEADKPCYSPRIACIRIEYEEGEGL